jgi:glucosyl-3-phosphoglycerate phosphatase
LILEERLFSKLALPQGYLLTNSYFLKYLWGIQNFGFREIPGKNKYCKIKMVLNNRYFLMRHGKSIANEKDLIVSNPRTGIKSWGLTEDGKIQVLQSLVENDFDRKNTFIFSCDFKRARETAEIAREFLEINNPIKFKFSLRERFFGLLEGASEENYSRVWKYDYFDPFHKKFNVESVIGVLNRAVSLVDEIESEFKNKTILLVGHGDVLQILSTLILDKRPEHHRDVAPIETAELKRVY